MHAPLSDVGGNPDDAVPSGSHEEGELPEVRGSLPSLPAVLSDGASERTPIATPASPPPSHGASGEPPWTNVQGGDAVGDVAVSVESDTRAAGGRSLRRVRWMGGSRMEEHEMLRSALKDVPDHVFFVWSQFWLELLGQSLAMLLTPLLSFPFLVCIYKTRTALVNRGFVINNSVKASLRQQSFYTPQLIGILVLLSRWRQVMQGGVDALEVMSVPLVAISVRAVTIAMKYGYLPTHMFNKRYFQVTMESAETDNILNGWFIVPARVATVNVEGSCVAHGVPSARDEDGNLEIGPGGRKVCEETIADFALKVVDPYDSEGIGSGWYGRKLVDFNTTVNEADRRAIRCLLSRVEYDPFHDLVKGKLTATAQNVLVRDRQLQMKMAYDEGVYRSARDAHVRALSRMEAARNPLTRLWARALLRCSPEPHHRHFAEEDDAKAADLLHFQSDELPHEGSVDRANVRGSKKASKSFTDEAVENGFAPDADRDAVQLAALFRWLIHNVLRTEAASWYKPIISVVAMLSGIGPTIGPLVARAYVGGWENAFGYNWEARVMLGAMLFPMTLLWVTNTLFVVVALLDSIRRLLLVVSCLALLSSDPDDRPRMLPPAVRFYAPVLDIADAQTVRLWLRLNRMCFHWGRYYSVRCKAITLMSLVANLSLQGYAVLVVNYFGAYGLTTVGLLTVALQAATLIFPLLLIALVGSNINYYRKRQLTTLRRLRAVVLFSEPGSRGYVNITEDNVLDASSQKKDLAARVVEGCFEELSQYTVTDPFRVGPVEANITTLTSLAALPVVTLSVMVRFCSTSDIC